ncbi:MAG: hypothetical protein ABL882_02030 [Sphingopyxis sp.]
MTAIVRRAQKLFWTGAPTANARVGMRTALWRELFVGPGPLWWRLLRWSQRASFD